MIDKLQMKTNKVKELQDEARALRDEINEMERVVKKVKSGKEWTPQKFAAVATQQQREIEKLKEQLNDCLGMGGFETLFSDGGTTGDNDHAPKSTKPSQPPHNL